MSDNQKIHPESQDEQGDSEFTPEEDHFWRREWAGRAMQGLVAHHGIDGLTIEHIAQCFGVAGQMLAADRAQKGGAA